MHYLGVVDEIVRHGASPPSVPCGSGDGSAANLFAELGGARHVGAVLTLRAVEQSWGCWLPAVVAAPHRSRFKKWRCAKL